MSVGEGEVCLLYICSGQHWRGVCVCARSLQGCVLNVWRAIHLPRALKGEPDPRLTAAWAWMKHLTPKAPIGATHCAVLTLLLLFNPHNKTKVKWKSHLMDESCHHKITAYLNPCSGLNWMKWGYQTFWPDCKNVSQKTDWPDVKEQSYRE